MRASPENRPEFVQGFDDGFARAKDDPPPAQGIVVGLMLAVPFWCCFGVMLWVFH
jgi:hypothetical protein